MCMSQRCVPGGRAGTSAGGCTWGVPGWVYRVGIPGWQYGVLPSHRARRVHTQRSGPRRPCRGRSGWGMGPGACLQWCSAAGTGIPPLRGPVGTLRVPPWIPSQNAASRPKGRDYTPFLRNLVKTAKCHPKSMKRPVIVPVSKTALKSHLLIF